MFFFKILFDVFLGEFEEMIILTSWILSIDFELYHRILIIFAVPISYFALHTVIDGFFSSVFAYSLIQVFAIIDFYQWKSIEKHWHKSSRSLTSCSYMWQYQDVNVRQHYGEMFILFYLVRINLCISELNRALIIWLRVSNNNNKTTVTTDSNTIDRI